MSNAGGLGILTALTQPSPDALREAIRKTKSMIEPQILKERESKYGAFGVNVTLLPSINPPDYEGYCRAALEEGVRIFETAGNNREYRCGVPWAVCFQTQQAKIVVHKGPACLLACLE